MVGPSSVPPFRSRDAEHQLVSYAQVGEDIRLARVLWDRSPGFYVDVGAGDATANSVTRLFYDAGWHGVNVEPGPAFERLCLARSQDVNLRVAVGLEEGEHDFWVCRPNTELSSLRVLDPATLPPGSRIERERVSVRTLDSILEEHGEPEIDFLKIDVEGGEADALASVDLGRFRPLVLIVEAIDPVTRRPSHAPWEPRVIEAGYVGAAFDGVNRFYVLEGHRELREALAYPLSTLDNYRPAGAVASPERAATTLEPAASTALAETPSVEPIDAVGAAHLLVAVDGAVDVGRVRSVVPPESTFIVLGGLPTGAEDVGRCPSQEALAETVRSDRCDVLLVSDDELLGRSLLRELVTALAEDSACATASADGRPAVSVAGIPPPAVDGPRRGVVLVRRDHLLLGLDEEPLLRHDGAGLVPARDDDDLVDRLLASLVRPGFVHRLCGRPVTERADHPRPSRATPRRHVDVVIDARSLEHPLSGSAVFTIGLLGGLARAGASVAALVPTAVHPTVVPRLAELHDAVPFLDRVGPGRPAVFHRPYQIGAPKLLVDCLAMGDRLVVTHLDMISDRTPAYARTPAELERYRAATAASLTSADQLAFLSHHAAMDAASEGAFALDRATVVHLGVDHLGASDVERPLVPPIGGRPYLLVVGVAYLHKNRLFALRLLEWLVDRHGWDGGLVLAGMHPVTGSSAAAEAAFLARSPSLAARVADLGQVSDRERDALYRGAELVLFPSLYEGFGFVPFEAAALGTPCAYSHTSSMRELLPRDGALPSFDLDEAGAFVLDLLDRPAARANVLAAVRRAAAPLTWDNAARGYLELYARATARGPRGVSRELLVGGLERSWEMDERELRMLDAYRRRRLFRVGVEGALRAGAATLRATRRWRA